MAPEHLEALARGDPDTDRVDARSDLYALGVVLLDCLFRGKRPFALASRSASRNEALLQAAATRQRALPGLRTTHPDVPAALEAVVGRCLAPEPSDRYASAAELAADLQAVADDVPLQFAREPFPSRMTRWLRRNRRRIALAAIMILAVAGVCVPSDQARSSPGSTSKPRSGTGLTRAAIPSPRVSTSWPSASSKRRSGLPRTTGGCADCTR